MSAATIAGALGQVLLGLAAGWVIADVALGWSQRRIDVGTDGVGDPLGLPERALCAICGLGALSVVLMVANVVTGGAVFGVEFIVPIVGVALVGFGIATKRWPRDIPWLKLMLFAGVLMAIYESPVLLEGSGVRAGDASFHMGWTEQLLGGDPIPSGPAPEFGRNAYPWGFHALMATMVRLVPATTTLVAQEALHLVMLLGIPLGAACLARRLRPGAGWLGAAAASLIGGFGWLVAREPAFVASPSEARFGADLVVASPNSVYELFPPAFPRELGLVVLATAAVLTIFAVAARNLRYGVLAGVVTGMVGLISAPLLGSALLWAVAGTLFADKGARARLMAAIGIPALAVFALWFCPVLVNYVEFGGFVNVTPQLGAEWPLPVALASWGLLLPASVAGLVLALRRRTPAARAVIGFAAATVVMVVASKARGALDWDLAGNATFLHQGRVWPAAHLLAAALAGAALGAAHSWLGARSRVAATVAILMVLAAGAASPVLASGGLRTILSEHEHGFVYGSENFATDSFVLKAASRLDPDDVVMTVPARGSNSLGFWLFQFSGCRIANYDDERLSHNDLRIRYRDLAAAWDARMASGGFRPDYVVMKLDASGISLPSGREVVRGGFLGAQWVLLRASP